MEKEILTKRQESTHFSHRAMVESPHNDQFLKALEISPIGKLMIDSERVIIFANQLIEKTFQYANSELIGQKIEKIFPCSSIVNQIDQRNSTISETTSEPMTIYKELFGKRKDGSEIPVQVGLAPFATSNGDFVLASVVDLSEKKKLECAIRSNKELEQFTYIASHDLQAPLRHISSYIEFLADKNSEFFDEESKQWIDTIQTGVDRMRNLINDLLKYSRVSRGAPELEDTNLGNVIEEVKKVLNPIINEYQATVTLDPMPIVQCTPNLMGEVFQNLIENAIKFHKNGVPPKIHISTKSHEENWEVVVADNGIGIDSQYLERIFTPFQRLHKQSEKPGTGIGLAIVKKIIEIHEGEVWVESKKDEGSVFHFTLPK